METTNLSKIKREKMLSTINEINEETLKNRICRFVKHMRHHLMLKGFIAILLFFCC